METTPFQSLKLAVLSATDLSRDAIHLHLGLLVFFLSALALRRPLRSFVPWSMVLAFACGVEALDAIDDLRTLGRWRVGASAHDIVNTMAWPTAMVFLARFSGLFGSGQRDGEP
jgi:hypothetical protein